MNAVERPEFSFKEFTEESFTDFDFRGADARGTLFEDCVFKNCTMDNMNLRGAEFINCEFWGTTLSGADLKRAMIGKIDYEYMTFVGTVNLDYVDIVTADFEYAQGMREHFESLVDAGLAYGGDIPLLEDDEESTDYSYDDFTNVEMERE